MFNRLHANFPPLSSVEQQPSIASELLTKVVTQIFADNPLGAIVEVLLYAVSRQATEILIKIDRQDKLTVFDNGNSIEPADVANYYRAQSLKKLSPFALSLCAFEHVVINSDNFTYLIRAGVAYSIGQNQELSVKAFTTQINLGNFKTLTKFVVNTYKTFGQMLKCIALRHQIKITFDSHSLQTVWDFTTAHSYEDKDYLFIGSHVNFKLQDLLTRSDYQKVPQICYARSVRPIYNFTEMNFWDDETPTACLVRKSNFANNVNELELIYKKPTVELHTRPIETALNFKRDLVELFNQHCYSLDEYWPCAISKYFDSALNIKEGFVNLKTIGRSVGEYASAHFGYLNDLAQPLKDLSIYEAVYVTKSLKIIFGNNQGLAYDRALKKHLKNTKPNLAYLYFPNSRSILHSNGLDLKIGYKVELDLKQIPNKKYNIQHSALIRLIEHLKRRSKSTQAAGCNLTKYKAHTPFRQNDLFIEQTEYNFLLTVFQTVDATFAWLNNTLKSFDRQANLSQLYIYTCADWLVVKSVEELYATQGIKTVMWADLKNQLVAAASACGFTIWQEPKTLYDTFQLTLQPQAVKQSQTCRQLTSIFADSKQKLLYTCWCLYSFKPSDKRQILTAATLYEELVKQPAPKNITFKTIADVFTCSGISQ